MVPADCIVLSTQDPLGQCYISTANLDGERNLKPKLAPLLTQKKIDNLQTSKVSVQCNDPSKDIYKFEGLLKVDD